MSDNMKLLQQLIQDKDEDKFERAAEELLIIDPNEQMMFLWASVTQFKSEMTFLKMLKESDCFKNNPDWHDFFYLAPNMFTQLTLFKESS